MNYRAFREQIHTAHHQAQRDGNREEEVILAKVLFRLPENKPREALANLTQLVQSTTDKEVQARYARVLRELAQLPEVAG